MKSGLWSTFADKCVTSNLYMTNNSHETNLLTLVPKKKHRYKKQCLWEPTLLYVLLALLKLLGLGSVTLWFFLVSRAFSLKIIPALLNFYVTKDLINQSDQKCPVLY